MKLRRIETSGALPAYWR